MDLKYDFDSMAHRHKLLGTPTADRNRKQRVEEPLGDKGWEDKVLTHRDRTQHIVSKKRGRKARGVQMVAQMGSNEDSMCQVRVPLTLSMYEQFVLL